MYPYTKNQAACPCHNPQNLDVLFLVFTAAASDYCLL